MLTRMKIYTLTMEVPEGNDEFWDGLATLTAREAKAELKRGLEINLAEHGWFDIKIKMGAIKNA
jgi:hypothetical protein